MELIRTLFSLRETKLATEVLEALEKHAWQFAEYDSLAQVWFKVKKYNDAIRNGEKALHIAYTNEQMWAARSNLINLYNHANFPEKAMSLIKMNEYVIPDDFDTKMEKAFSHFLLGERDKAEQILKDALTIKDLTEEQRVKVTFNLGTYCMYRDEFQKGLSMFLHEGEKMDFWRKAKLPFKFWRGEDFEAGSTILVYAEAGIGDEIINIRFCRHLKEIGLNPVWITDRAELIEIFNQNGFKAQKSWKEFSPDTLWTYSMSLPVYLNLEYPDLWSGPYLKHDGSTLEKIGNGKNVGVRWQGNPEYDHDLHRSVPLAEILDALGDGFDLYSLQRDTGLEEMDGKTIVPLHDELKTLKNLMAAISQMDFVVTSCTSVAHMAAAMGKKTYIFVSLSAYYTWTHSGDQSPWYGDHVTLLRQEKPRCWKAPCEKLRKLIQDK